VSQLAWSEHVAAAEWIGPRLLAFGDHRVGSVVPGGFEAYARVLHPAEEPGPDGRLVRWAEVAAWSGQPLGPDSQFHSIALPPVRPSQPGPWGSQGPRQGSLYPPDALVLAGLARDWTATPDRCWFCIWDGYGWGPAVRLTPVGQPAEPVPDPLPAEVRSGPRVRLPNREYLLYTGPAEEVTAPSLLGEGLPGDDQTANLWWPDDQAWCVASEIDLGWSYIGGPAGLIGQVLADPRIEALPASPDDPVSRVEDWVYAWAEVAAEQLMTAGTATISTSRGTVRATLRRPSWHGSGWLETSSSGDNGVDGSSRTRLSRATDAELRDEICHYLIWQLIGLVGS
jgi:hypothetical protein